ncbi:MAG: carbohydrate binding family 9 domain-containing protein [Acidobacteria bacterium]|nr:carbohydrate binding family 9 domain-containing protein [Acidobacteriota bacterium]
MRHVLTNCLLIAAVALPSSASAQEIASRTRAPFPIPATTASVTLDGAVTESLWEDALTLELRYEVRPGENIPPPVRTEMLLAHDDRNLYVAFRCYDDDPAAIRARFSDRDTMWNDDFVGVVLDTFNDERRAYEFFANPLGVQGDMLMDDVSGNEDAAWNAIWDSAGRITEAGYEVEMVIPFSQLRFQTASGPQTWGLDGIRSYPRRDRHHLTLFPRIRGENSYLAQEEKISGFSGIRPGQNLEVIPTVTALRSDARADFPRGRLTNLRSEGDLGVTAKWGITPNITVNGTINPDFSQVEADAVQLDVNNQFALFFGETRPFFLEGSDFFRTSRLNLLHTRQVAQPNGALKVSGKTGRHAFGLFSAQDETTTIILPESQRSRTRVLDAETVATVGRYRFDVGDNSTVGAMVTDRRGGRYFNNVVAIDSRHRFSAADSISATLAYSSTTDAPSIAALTSADRRSAAAVDVLYNHSVRNWNAYATYRGHGKDFRADLGFITQVDVRRWEAGGGRIWHGDQTRFYNRIQVSGNFDQTEDEDRSLIEREWEGYIFLNGRRESFVQWGGGRRTFVFGGVRFDQVFQGAYGELRPSQAVQFSLGVNWGDWIDFAHTRAARQRTIRPGVNLNYGRHLAVRVRHIYDTLDVAGGRLFSAHVPELRLIYQRDVRTLVRAIVQYTGVSRDARLYLDAVNRESRDLFAQLLFSYKVNAQTALYFGYVSGARGTEEFALTHANRTLFAKVGYAWLR